MIKISRYAHRYRMFGVVVLSVGLLVSACKKPATETQTPQSSQQAAQATEKPAATTQKYMDPPPASEPKPVQFPEVKQFYVDRNKLAVYVVENHEVPLVNVRLVVNAGQMDDRYLADMTASMLGEGTKKRSKAQLDEAIESVGAQISANAGTHNTYISTTVLKPNVELALALMADEVMNPAFPEDALAKVKEQTKASIKMMRSNPDVLANVLFDMIAYPEGHPYGQPLPKEADIEAISKKQLSDFHQRFYRSNNAFLILSGDITVDEAKRLVASSKAFGPWKPFEKQEDFPPNPLNRFEKKDYQLPQKLTVHLVDRPASAQSEIRVGNLAMSRRHEDWLKLKLASDILGGGASGRLFRDLREEKGLTYGIYSGVSSGQAPGTWQISTNTQTSKTGEMLQGIFAHIEEMRNKQPSEEEFTDTIQQTTGSFPLEIETPQQVASKVYHILTFGLPQDYYQTYRDKVRAIKREEMKSTAETYMRNIPVVVVVGKAAKIEPLIKEALPQASIIKYNQDLQPM